MKIKRTRMHAAAAALILTGYLSALPGSIPALAAGTKTTTASTTAASSTETSSAKTLTRWDKLRNKYRNSKGTNRLIFVQYKGGTRATLKMYKKVKNTSKKRTEKYIWKLVLKCNAFVGRNGINKQREGDVKTPTGTFKISEGFGIKNNPGLKGLKYTKLKWYHYWSAEQATYNKMVDVRTLGRTWMSGEHLIKYVPHYNYALNMGYNPNGIYKKGAALFLHCTGSNPYTGGCVAVSEKNMITIMKNTTSKTRICIYPIK